MLCHLNLQMNIITTVGLCSHNIVIVKFLFDLMICISTDVLWIISSKKIVLFDIIFSVPPPSPPQAKDCVSHNCNTNAHNEFIFYTTIHNPEWKNHFDFGESRKNKMANGGNFVTIGWKSFARRNFARNEPINFILYVVIDLPGMKSPIDLDENRSSTMAVGGHLG